ncbi:bifunctional UDP-N-acetylglucosamine diphosphorylase/glucosamine-1-phosphate N-acetyltransferase GlmU [Sodalis sp. CWE]|uniref:bifunctional UDP-N-acetylglucosamine diphosphorylase/glucosamine-1-phosphate N-acetyltransferase GlmU n=1 Tax=Sodalis sp. CWE TaxID=2803816 RepID=UPI001C7DF8F3|nr:bifunctional UDP-N-acetylglucosamine diphosphorylase/glucosamine-1-phosphate N-acetyltransferase GlmU [Sodalis sp. CWE]MBX4181096.1 bifunctional UDP-N-acetylglucosamine diphosphorylase/glucosamine-1-phosphate N-acetyltransferase GlmU [Sodalis sp. CWE]
MDKLNRTLSVIILAAGRGSRMFSSLPKALHPIAGKPMVQYVIDVAIQLDAASIYFVYNHQDNQLLREQLVQYNKILNWILQPEQLGTGHAVQQVMPFLSDREDVLILYSDIPLISSNTLKSLLMVRPYGGIALLTRVTENPMGYGRILRFNNEVVGIIEQKDVSEQQRQIKEVNTGIIAVGSEDIKRWLRKLTNKNAQNELYLTDIVAIAWNEGRKINTVQPIRKEEVEGVNTRVQLAQLERLLQKQKAEHLLLSGVMLSDPDRFDLRGELCHGEDIFIDTNVVLKGQIILGDRVTIGTGCVLTNVVVGNDVTIHPYTIIEESHIAAWSVLGPFARLRSGSHLEEKTHVGNFVELQQAHLGKASKANHLSYLGNVEIGARVNIGAGTITCNYDGVNKHKTYIGDDVFIGSDSQLISPVSIGNGATIGAGTTVTHDVNEGEAIISRIRQFSITNNWKRPMKKK